MNFVFQKVNTLKPPPVCSAYTQNLHVSINLLAETPSGLEFRAGTDRREAHTGSKGRMSLNMGPFFAYRTTCCVFPFRNAY